MDYFSLFLDDTKRYGFDYLIKTKGQSAQS